MVVVRGTGFYGEIVEREFWGEKIERYVGVSASVKPRIEGGKSWWMWMGQLRQRALKLQLGHHGQRRTHLLFPRRRLVKGPGQLPQTPPRLPTDVLNLFRIILSNLHCLHRVSAISSRGTRTSVLLLSLHHSPNSRTVFPDF